MAKERNTEELPDNIQEADLNLTPAAPEEFEILVKGVKAGEFVHDSQFYHHDHLTIDQARDLIKKGYPHLVVNKKV